MGKEEKNYNLNNGTDVVNRLKGKKFPEEICRIHLSESGTGEVTISERSINTGAKTLVDLWDED